MGYIAPVDPIPLADGLGDVLPIDNGRSVWRLSELSEGATEDAYLAYNRFIAALRAMGQTVVVGGLAELGCAVAKMVDEGEL